MKQYFKSLLIESDISLTDMQIDQFLLYMDLLIEWNNKFNLTAITEPKEIITKHFIDCLLLAKHSNIKEDASIIDIGTGAGFPGIPLKIFYKDLKVTLLDSLNKRITFLDEVVNQLNLTDVELIHGRAEDFGQDEDYRESFDYTLSRAVAELNVLSEYSLPFLKIGGRFVSMKSKKTNEEIENAKNAIEILGGSLESIKEFTIPNSNMSRSLVSILKISNTPSKYPRKSGKPTKKPL